MFNEAFAHGLGATVPDPEGRKYLGGLFKRGAGSVSIGGAYCGASGNAPCAAAATIAGGAFFALGSTLEPVPWGEKIGYFIDVVTGSSFSSVSKSSGTFYELLGSGQRVGGYVGDEIANGIPSANTPPATRSLGLSYGSNPHPNAGAPEY